MAPGPKKNVAWISQSEPKFLREMKKKAGLACEGDLEEEPKQTLHAADEEGAGEDGLKPVVVVMKEGDLTAEEAEKHLLANPDAAPKNSAVRDVEGCGKIVFNSLKKRKKEEEENDIVEKALKKAQNPGETETKEPSPPPSKPETVSEREVRNGELAEIRAEKKIVSKAIKNTNLLSFNDDEEEG